MSSLIQRPIGIFCLAAAVLSLLSIPLVLPPWAFFWQSDFFARDPNDKLSFVLWALGISVFLALLGLLAGRVRSAALDNIALLLVILAAVVLTDWILLAHKPRSIYVHDVQTTYRYRPNGLQAWPEKLGGKPIRINGYGYHDDEFPREKKPGEFRAVMLGDSVTMGHGVTRRETFSNQLEDLINQQRPEACRSQIINTGVGGFAVHQEYVLFEEALAFRPDFAAQGFVLNDVSEPFVTDRKFGGIGVAYNRMAQTDNALIGWLLNETGFGRLARAIHQTDQTMDQAWRHEVFRTKRVAFEAESNPQIKKAWELVKEDLARVYALARKQQVPFVQLIFPFTFQFLDQDSKLPQAILKRHAAEHRIDTIDFVEIFERLILQDSGVQEEIKKGRSAEEIRKSQADVIARYFLDEDHLTPEGHQVVARELLDYLVRKGLVDPKQTEC